MVTLQERSDAWRRAADIKSRLQVSSRINITAFGISNEVVHLLKSTFPNTCWYNVGVTYERLIWCQIVYAWCKEYQVVQIQPLALGQVSLQSCPAIKCRNLVSAVALRTQICNLYPAAIRLEETALYFPTFSYSALLTNTIGIFPHKYKQPIVVKGLPARIKSAETKLVKQLGGGSLDLFELMIVDL